MSNWLALNKKRMRSARYQPFEKAEKVFDLTVSNEHLNSIHTSAIGAVNLGDPTEGIR